MGRSSTDIQRKQKKKRRKKRESVERKFQIWLSCTTVNSGCFGVALVCTITHKICAGEIPLQVTKGKNRKNRKITSSIETEKITI